MNQRSSTEAHGNSRRAAAKLRESVDKHQRSTHLTFMESVGKKKNSISSLQCPLRRRVQPQRWWTGTTCPVVGNFWLLGRTNRLALAGWWRRGLSFIKASLLVVPTRSKEDTNPLSEAAPAQHGDGFVLDTATSAASLGKTLIVVLVAQMDRLEWRAQHKAGVPGPEKEDGQARRKGGESKRAEDNSHSVPREDLQPYFCQRQEVQHNVCQTGGYEGFPKGNLRRRDTGSQEGPGPPSLHVQVQ
ncbi:uncharacterized protein LOC122835583 [Gambusia affinis]|uniref:uncharacterized protein LOC122835583 n=1 Tax=Gambusia affinis TaxID=33528 RepID=UPI001CDC18B0|nr:uncharacterized protein LOC122835583 [Gambusia affinis]